MEMKSATVYYGIIYIFSNAKERKYLALLIIILCKTLHSYTNSLSYTNSMHILFPKIFPSHFAKLAAWLSTIFMRRCQCFEIECCYICKRYTLNFYCNHNKYSKKVPFDFHIVNILKYMGRFRWNKFILDKLRKIVKMIIMMMVIDAKNRMNLFRTVNHLLLMDNLST